jgi:nicotinamidase-related amidase
MILNLEKLFICTMLSNMRIDTSVRAAKSRGLKVVVLEDACATKDLVWNGEIIPAQTVHNTIMASLNGTFAEVIKVRSFFAGI